MEKLINEQTPISVIGMILYQIGMQAQSLKMTSEGALQGGSASALQEAIKKNQELRDYLVDLLDNMQTKGKN